MARILTIVRVGEVRDIVTAARAIRDLEQGLNNLANTSVAAVGVFDDLTVNNTLTIDGVAVSGSATWNDPQDFAGGISGPLANALTFGTHLQAAGTSYNNSAAVTIATDATAVNTASTIVARDSSGNFAAGTITATFVGALAAGYITAGTFGSLVGNGDFLFPGALTVATNIRATNGFILSTGAQSQFAITRRDTLASAWAWYSQTGSFQIFDNVAGVDKVVMLQGGAISFTNAAAAGFNVGPNGATNPAFQVDTSVGSLAAGLKVTGATSAGTVALAVISSGSNANLSVDAKGSGTITFGGTSTGAITLTRATTMSNALTYGGVTLTNAVTGTGKMVLSDSPTFTGTVTAPTLVGALAAGYVNAGTFGSLATPGGDYTFPANLAVTTSLVVGHDYGTSAVVRVGNATSGDGRIEFFDPASPGARVQLTTYATGVSTGPQLLAQKARGTFAAPLIINAADTQMLRIRASGYAPAASGFSTGGGSIYIQSGAAWTDGSSYPVYISFRNILSGSTTEAERWRIEHTGGHFIAGTDNTYDIGASGATRPRTGYFGTSLVVGTDPGGLWTLRASSDATGTNNVTVLFENTGATGDILIARRVTDTAANGAGWIGQRSRTAGASVVANDVLAGLYGQGYTGSAYSANVGAIRIQAVETFSGGGQGTQIDFATTDVGATSRTGRWVIRSTGHFVAFTDNVNDIGASGATRPRTGYFGTSVVTGTAFTPVGASSHAVYAAGDSGAGFEARSSGTTPQFIGALANGTLASPTEVTTGNFLVTLQGAGWDSAAYGFGGRVIVRSVNLWTGSNHQSDVHIQTVPSGSTTRTTTARFESNGQLTLGSSAGVGLYALNALGISFGSDNAADVTASATRARTVYGYTGNFATAVIAGASDPGGTAPIRANGVINAVNGAFKNTGTYTVTSGEGLSAITTSATITAATGSVRNFFANATMVAAANADNLEGMRISVLTTPGAFTGVVARGLVLSSFSVAGFTSPGDTKMIQTGVLTGTGATNARGIEIGQVTGATNNYALTTNGGVLLISGTFTMNSGQGALYIDSTVTATGGTARAMYNNATLVAAANSDALTSARIQNTRTPGAFTGVVSRSLQLGAMDVSGFTSPGDPIMLDIGVLTGTGATNAYGIKFGSGPTGATNNYLLHATNFNVTSAGGVTGVTGAFSTRVTSPLLGTTTNVDVVFDRNSVAKLTLGNTTDTFANNTITNGNADWVFQRNASTIFTLAAASLTMNLPVLTKAYTVATLPAGTKGMVAHVTDALAPAFLTAVVGGGAAFALVAYDGTNWVAV